MKRGEEARVNLEGGLTTLLEGLEYSRFPCVHCLSVAGFFASLARFPAGGRVYSEGKEPLLASREPSLLQPVTNNCWYDRAA